MKFFAKLTIVILFSLTTSTYCQFFNFKDFEFLSDEFILDGKIDNDNLYILTSEKVYTYRIGLSQLELLNVIDIPTKKSKRGLAGKINLHNEIIEGNKYFLLISLNFLKNIILISDKDFIIIKDEFFEVTNSNFEDGEIKLKTRWASIDGFSFSGKDSFLVISKPLHTEEKSEISLPYQIPVDYFDACFIGNEGDKSLIVVDEEGFVRLYNMIAELMNISEVPYGASLICKDIDNDNKKEIIITSSEDRNDKVIMLKIEDNQLISKWESGKVDGRIIKLIDYKDEVFGVLEKNGLFKLFSLTLP